MKILIVTRNLPYPLDDGSNLRLYNIIKRLSNNHNLYLFSVVNDPECKRYEKDINIFFKAICYTDIPAKMSNIFRKKWLDYLAMKKAEKSIRKFIMDNDIDVAHMHYQRPAQFTINEVSQAVPVVMDFVDAMSLYHLRRKVKESLFNLPVMFRQYYNIVTANRIERRLLRLSKISMAVSLNDVEALCKNSPGSIVETVANGVDTEFFDADKNVTRSVDENTIVFIGNMDFPPNIDAVTYFVREIFPLIRQSSTDIQFKIVGKNPVSVVSEMAKLEGIQVLGYVDDVRDYYSEAAVVVIPMVSGGGIKNKVLEAFSMRKAVVATPLGVEAISCVDNEHVLLADTAASFAEKVVMIMADSDNNKTLGANARQLVIADYSWDTVAHQLESIYERSISDKA